MARTRRSALYVAAESTYGTDPDSDGSSYTFVPTLGTIGLLKDGRELLETKYFLGRNFPTTPIQGRDGWSLDFEVPITGLSVRAGEGTNASTVAADYLDVLFAHMFTAVTTTIGTGVATNTTTAITTDADSFIAQDLIPLFETNNPAAATQRTSWELVTVRVGASSYTITNWADHVNFTAAGTIFGTKMYQPSDAGGASLAFAYVQDDLVYTLLGGRITSAVITGEVGQLIKMKISASGDTKIDDTTAKTGNLISGSGAVVPNRSPCVTLRSPVRFGTTTYPTRKIEIDLGLVTAVQESSGAANGRANYESISVNPKITIEPLYSDANLNLKRDVTTGRLLVQMGSGVLSGTIANTAAIHAEVANVMEADATDDQGRLRQQIVFQVVDGGIFTGSTVSRHFQFVRA